MIHRPTVRNNCNTCNGLLLIFLIILPHSHALVPSVRERGSYTTKDSNLTNENIL
jgi:hypothetical protein